MGRPHLLFYIIQTVLTAHIAPCDCVVNSNICLHPCLPCLISSSAAMEWANVSDVETLRSMLASQQQQLQQLQQQQPGAIEANTGSKRKATSNPTSELTGSDSAAEEAQLDKDDDMWEPADDSDYDDAPKKKQKSSKKGSSKKSKQQDEASYGADAPSKEQEKTSKAAAAALKSIKSAINQQMVRSGRGRCTSKHNINSTTTWTFLRSAANWLLSTRQWHI